MNNIIFDYNYFSANSNLSSSANKMKFVVTTFGSLPSTKKVMVSTKNTYNNELIRDIPHMSEETLQIMRRNASSRIKKAILTELAIRKNMFDWKVSQLKTDDYEDEDFNTLEDVEALADTNDDDFQPFGETFDSLPKKMRRKILNKEYYDMLDE